MSATDGTTPAPATPELDKRSEILDEAHRLGEFIDFLDNQGILLCTFNTRDDRWSPAVVSDSAREKLLAEYFGLDLDTIEAERDAILAHLRAQR